MSNTAGLPPFSYGFKYHFQDQPAPGKRPSLGTIFRLLDLGVEPYLVASSVIGVIAQRLVRLICKHCKAEYQPTVSCWKIGKRVGSQQR